MKKRLSILLCCTGLSLAPVTTSAQSWGVLFPEAGVDVTQSLGKFVITFSQEFVRGNAKLAFLCQNFLPPQSCPEIARTVVSPLLYEAETHIGRSVPHHHGDNVDKITGAIICRQGQPSGCNRGGFYTEKVKDSDFKDIPELPGAGNFKMGPPDTEEIHTRIVSLNMVPLEEISANRVRAGEAAPSQKWSIGEVESMNPPNIDGFPGESFFDMNVEIDLDVDKDNVVDFTLESYFEQPLVVQASGLMGFPPAIVYVHDTSLWAVPIYDTKDPNGVHVGWIRIAGHGINLTTARKGMRNSSISSDAIDNFLNIFQKLPLLPVPCEEMANPDDCPKPPPQPQVCDIEKDCPKLVELELFTYLPSPHGKVFLMWATTSEIDNVGFNILRGRKAVAGENVEYTLEDGTNLTEITQVNDQLIPAKGISFWGYSYAYTDNHVLPSNTYYYAIQDIDSQGKKSVHLDNLISVEIP